MARFVVSGEEMKSIFAAAVALTLAYAMPAHSSCGSAFCTINTSWDVQGGWSEPGARLDLRYESITQDRPRSGSRGVALGEIRRHHDEVSTRNRNWLGTFDYAFDDDWGLSVSAPLVEREHLHTHNHQGQQLPEAWDFRAAGDARVLARYQGFNFGLKLPTGRFNLRNSEGELAERSLQPGSGTTDALLGVHTSHSLPLQDLSWFAQVLLQLPLNNRDGYRPGRRLGIDTGIRYDLGEQWSLMLQANALLRGRDRGVQAEPEDTGGSALWIGPGASYAATRDMRVYAFLQVPVAQYVNGVQITARKAAVVGISARF